MQRSTHRPLPSVLTLAIFFLGVGLAGCGGQSEAPAVVPIHIQSTTVKKSDIDLSREFVGRTIGSIDADVRARVQGILLKQHFNDGTEVTEGQLLYSIDPAPFLARVAEAKALVAEANTRLIKAQADFRRIEPLAAIDAVSKRDLDKAVAEKGVAEGSVDAANAQLEAANIQLSYTNVVAPTTGTIGISKAKIGELVGSPINTTVLNTVSKLDPIHVQFTVNEAEYLYFARLAKENGPEHPARSLELILADKTVMPHRGTVVKIDRGVDPKSGAITIEAAFPNEDKFLRPGLFAKIRTIAETRRGALLIPKKAIKEVQGKYFVFVIDNESKADQRAIEVGPVSGEMQEVISGLTESETIAIDGVQRLRSGSLVEMKKVTQ
jgi:membrane fusion protein (multidrug efflux system)